MSRPARSLQERFWEKVGPTDANGCRLWLAGTIARGGYGIFNVAGKSRYAHRVAWEMKNGPLPRKSILDHWRLNEILLPGESPLCSTKCIVHLRTTSIHENCASLRPLSDPRIKTCRSGRHRYASELKQCPECRSEWLSRKEAP